MHDRDELPDVPSLRVLAPPPGGLRELRARLDTPPRWSRWWLAAPVVAAAAALAVLWDSPHAREHEAEVPDVAAAPIADPTIGPDFHWVTSAPASPAPPPAAVPTGPPMVIDVRDAIAP